MGLLVTAAPAGAQDPQEPPRERQADRRPVITGLGVAPEQPRVGQTVTLTVDAYDPDGDPLAYAWELDGDGRFDDAAGPTAQRIYAAAGVRRVRVAVSDPRGRVRIAGGALQILPADAAPVAGFGASPATPTVGEVVTFSSTASDPDGDALTHAWDLDGDGAYDDGTAPSVTRACDAPGEVVVRLRVSDGRSVGETERRIAVAPRPAPPAPAPPAPPVTAPSVDPPAPERLAPFPVVRLVGRFTPRGARIRALFVTAPAGARIAIECRGRRCTSRRTITAPGRMRVRRAQGSYRAGARLIVRITAPGRVGKYTSFRMHRGKPPTRKDLCLAPGRSDPRPCGMLGA